MEAHLAQEGKVEELREWLKAHPSRVNVPIPPAKLTLLYYALQGPSKSDVSLLQQGRPNRYDKTIQMLCEEFGADPDAPNGGEGNTAVHFAVEMNDPLLLSYFVCKRKAKMSPNWYGESPLAFAKRKHPDSECVSILQREIDLRESYQQRAAQTEHSRRQEESNLHSLRARLNMLRIGNSDDDSDTDNNTSGHQGGQQQQQQHVRQFSTSGMTAPPTRVSSEVVQLTPSLSSTTNRSGNVSPPPRGGGAAAATGANNNNALPRQSSSVNWGGRGGGGQDGAGPCGATGTAPPATPRGEVDLSKERTFKDKELEEFRTTFGNGFTYLKCNDHYEIRGLLPYKFKGNEYFTPVIIFMYGPRRQTPQLPPPSPLTTRAGGSYNGSNDATTSSTFAGPNGEPGWQVSYSRYRAVLDYERMNDYAISRKAEYIDPLSGAIMPSSADAVACTSLVDYVRSCIIENFERTAPMVTRLSTYAFDVRPSLALLGSPTDLYRHHHSSNAPPYLKNVLLKRDASRVWAYRVLQDLSRFGDGLFTFDLSSRTATGVIPIVREKQSSTEVLVLASPSPSVSTARSFRYDPSSHIGGLGGAKQEAVADNTVTKTHPIYCEMIFLVRTVIHFPSGGESGPGSAASGQDLPRGFPPPPRFYLLDCVDPATRHHPGSEGVGVGAGSGGLTRSYSKANYSCFGALLENTTTGLVKAEVLQPCIDNWYLAQKATYGRITEKEQRQKQRTGGVGGPPPPSSLPAPPPFSVDGELCDMLTTLQKRLAKTLEEFVDSYQRLLASGAGRGGKLSTAATGDNPLDAFFSDSSNTSSPVSGVPGLNAAMAAEGSSRNNCLICFKQARSTVFQPCRHAACCTVCVQRLANHVRGGGFDCPVCRAKVREVQRIYL